MNNGCGGVGLVMQKEVLVVPMEGRLQAICEGTAQQRQNLRAHGAPHGHLFHPDQKNSAETGTMLHARIFGSQDLATFG